MFAAGARALFHKVWANAVHQARRPSRCRLRTSKALWLRPAFPTKSYRSITCGARCRRHCWCLPWFGQPFVHRRCIAWVSPGAVWPQTQVSTLPWRSNDGHDTHGIPWPVPTSQICGSRWLGKSIVYFGSCGSASRTTFNFSTHLPTPAMWVQLLRNLLPSPCPWHPN